MLVVISSYPASAQNNAPSANTIEAMQAKTLAQEGIDHFDSAFGELSELLNTMHELNLLSLQLAEMRLALSEIETQQNVVGAKDLDGTPGFINDILQAQADLETRREAVRGLIWAELAAVPQKYATEETAQE